MVFRFLRSDKSASRDRAHANESFAGRTEPKSISGYEASLLVDVVFAKTKALRPEDIPSHTGAERTLFSVLLAARITGREPVRVLDFGGACGFHHMAAELISVPLKWAVVESAAMVEKAQVLASGSLRFFTDIAEAARWLDAVDLMFSSSALQYMDEPDETLRRLAALRAPLMVWSRLPMTEGPPRRELQKSRLGENGPGQMPEGFEDRDVFYTRTNLALDQFITEHNGYRLVMRSGDLSSAGFIFIRDDIAL